MKHIRLSVTDVEYAEHRATRRNERIARRVVRRLKREVARGERHYNLKTDSDYVGVFASLADFYAYGLPDGAAVRVKVRLRPSDGVSASQLMDIAASAMEAHESISDALLRSLSASMKRDITALLDWAAPYGVPLYRDSVYVYVEESKKEERRRITAARGLGLGAPSVAASPRENDND